MDSAFRNADWLITRGVSPSLWRMFFLFSSFLFVGTVSLHSQCPNTGQTKVIKPNHGTGYDFYVFRGDNSFRYFLDGKTFSFNDKGDSGRTFVFIDDIAYESIVVESADLAGYVKSSKAEDILRAQAKHHQEYFKGAVPSIVIKDYGPSSTKNPDGTEGRLFYLWKKENPAGKEAATQYLLSTLVKDGVVVLSIIVTKASVTEDDMFLKIQKYTSRFDTLSSKQCAQVLSMPTAP